MASKPSTTPVRVLLVQDHPLLASAIAKILDSYGDLSVVGIAGRSDEAATLAAAEKPSVVLMDFRLPDSSGPDAAAKIRSAMPSAAIVFHSADESEAALLDAIDAGATAYLTKSATADQIVDAVRKASIGEVLIPVALFAKAIARQRRLSIELEARKKMYAGFTPREIEVLRLVADGQDTVTVAMRLGIAPHTVEWHVRHLIEKLGAHSKLQAVVTAARLGLIEI
jgi:two-component system nitrate/nitrite response regulator NarL